jgi:hypothetical protein
MANDECFDVSPDVFLPPHNPGATATNLAGMTAAYITEANRAHVEATCVYRTYHNMDQAFKKIIIDAFEDPFLNSLSDETVGYANWMLRKFITHLLT